MMLLIIPDKPDVERDALAVAWQKKYGEVLRVGKFWNKPEINENMVALYGYDSFCLVLAQLLNLELLSPRDEIIASLDTLWVKRKVWLMTVADTDSITFPAFVKPVTPKIFKSQVYNHKQALEGVLHGLENTERILVSTIITVEKEVRVFVLDNRVKDLAFYEGSGNLEEANSFAQDFLQQNGSLLPKTFVMDLGYNKQSGWFVIEFNSSWGAGLNSCNPELVIDCIKEAVVKME